MCGRVIIRPDAFSKYPYGKETASVCGDY